MLFVQNVDSARTCNNIPMTLQFA